VVDIGSNSVRLVAYEGLTRAPTPLFNEKVLAGLGRNVASTGRLPEDGVREAFDALRRFRALCDLMDIEDVRVLATAAARDAQNGPEFIAEAERLIGRPIELISGPREAQLSALGVVSGIHRPSGVVGDLGGGSLELVQVNGDRIGQGSSLRIGGLALQDLSARSLKRAARLVKDALDTVPFLASGARRPFYAIGGTWRALAKLHMRELGYPLNVMHGYTIPAAEAIEFCRLLQRVDLETIGSITAVASNRRQLLPYGALVLEQVLKRLRSDRLVFSMLGVREGLLFDLLDADERARDPLIAAATELNILRSRSPRHGEDLYAWSDRLLASCHFDETAEERRLRHAACLLADIGWRAHPDYRGEQSLNIIANAAFVGLDHPGRAYLALSVFYRHSGISDEDLSPRLKELATLRLLERARLLGAIMRVAYIISAAMPDVLLRAPLTLEHGRLHLRLPPDLEALAGDRLSNRLRQLGRLLGRETMVRIDRPAAAE
jgi:exopolyphosphatase/guanosine-5'-triphosphate,3'-diphosphate pyrophosphatase